MDSNYSLSKYVAAAKTFVCIACYFGRTVRAAGNINIALSNLSVVTHSHFVNISGDLIQFTCVPHVCLSGALFFFRNICFLFAVECIVYIKPY